MKIINRINVDDYISICIVEYNTPIITNNFNNRFQLFLSYHNNQKFFLLKNKLKYTKFYCNHNSTNNIKYYVESDIYPNKIITLNIIQYHTKLIYDKSYNDCLLSINNVQNIKSISKKYLYIYLNFNINILKLIYTLCINTMSNKISLINA